jgi:hypothetical protein
MATENTALDTSTEEKDDLRGDIEAAFRQHATDEKDEPTKAAPAPAPEPAAAPTEGDGRVRDSSGRFAPKTGDAPVQAPTAAQAPATQEGQAFTPAPQPPELKAPASWTPQARERWAALDPEVRAEVHRREGELQTVLQRSASARQFTEAFEQVMRPYEVFIRQENSNPLQAVQNMMQTAATMRVGTAQQKAETVAGIIRNFGVDIEQLDSLLAGQLPPQGSQRQQEFRDPRFDQFLAAQQALIQQNESRQMQTIHQEVQAFASGHEFYADVQPIMADLMAIRAKQGQALDLEGAYKLACGMHEGVAATIAQRAASSQNAGQSQAVLRAKRAAASVKGDPTPHTGATVPKDDSVRSSIEAAIQQLRE